MKDSNCVVIYLFNKPKNIMKKIFLGYEDLATFYAEKMQDARLQDAKYAHGVNLFDQVAESIVLKGEKLSVHGLKGREDLGDAGGFRKKTLPGVGSGNLNFIGN
jgi:hypothetical protein